MIENVNDECNITVSITECVSEENSYVPIENQELNLENEDILITLVQDSNIEVLDTNILQDSNIKIYKIRIFHKVCKFKSYLITY